jgi:hypothetical protein
MTHKTKNNMETKERFEIGQDVYVVLLDRNKNERYYITSKVMDVTFGRETTYVCMAYADSKLYNISENEVFATYQEAEEYCKKYTIMKIKTKLPEVELTDFEKLKIAYEVIRDLETRDDIRAGVVNSITIVKNILANDIAFDVTFGKR